MLRGVTLIELPARTAKSEGAGLCLAVKLPKESEAVMNEQEAHPQQPLNVAKRTVVGMVAGGIVTAVVMAVSVGSMNKELEGEGPVQRAVVGFVAGMILGAVGGITGRLVRGIVAGLVVGAILIGISAMAHPAVGVAGELRSFDTGSIKGEIAAAIYGMVIGAIGGGVGGASSRLAGPKK